MDGSDGFARLQALRAAAFGSGAFAPSSFHHARRAGMKIMRQHARFLALRREQGLLFGLRREVAGRRQARSGPAGLEPKFYQNIILDRNQTMYLVLSSCTRYTDFQKLDFLKIYISRFFRAKTCQGTTQNMLR